MKTKSITPESTLWPRNLNERIYSGFSDDELEEICGRGLLGYDKKLGYRQAAWIYWPAELYSFGRCYRDWLSLPSWLPLPLYGDHGVALSGNLSPHEKTSKPKVHLTWFKDRAESLRKNSSSKKILHIPHPWVIFRHRHGFKKKVNACGTLVFFSHSNDGIEIVDYDFDKYFSDLKLMPDEYHPLVICMHRHDVEKKYHLKMRKYGLPIISAGETSSPYFVERFYNMISNFNFATSNSGGSEMFYCEEFGVPYFIKGEQPTYVNFSHPEMPLGTLKNEDETSQSANHKKRALFSLFPPINSGEKERFVSDALGLDIDTEDAKKELKNLLLVEYARHIPEVMFRLTRSVVLWIFPYRIQMLLRSVRSNFCRILR